MQLFRIHACFSAADNRIGRAFNLYFTIVDGLEGAGVLARLGSPTT
jgi:hypothetical protein